MKRFDHLATGAGFFYRGNKKFKSKVGGILSIILYISALICFLSYFVEFFQQQKWSSINKITITDSTDWQPFEIKVLHKSLKTEEGLHDLYYQINEQRTIFFNRNMTCNKEQMQEMDMEPDSDYNFFCFKINEFLSHSIKKRCYHSKAALMNTNCFTNERNVTVRFLSYYLDSAKMGQPIKKFHDAKEVYGKKNQIFVTYNRLEDDTNYFFEDPKISYFSEVWFQEDMKSLSNEGAYTISPLVDVLPLQKLKVQRKTAKFNDVLAKALGIIELISIFFLGFHRFIYSEFAFNKKQLEWWLEKGDDLYELPQPSEVNLNSSKIKFFSETPFEVKNNWKEDMKSTYNFKNYFKHLLGYYQVNDEEMKKFINLHTKLKDFLSIENNLLETEFNLHNENDNTLCKIFRSMDFNAKGPLFMIRGQKMFKTTWGGIFTLNVLIGSIAIFYYFGQDFWRRINPLISYSQFNLQNLTSNSRLFDVPIMIAISKSLADYSKLVYLNSTSNYQYFDLDARICGDQDFKLFNVTSPTQNLKYYCSNYNKIFLNVTDLSKKLDSYIYLANCSELAEYNINDSECKGNKEPEFGSLLSYNVWMATEDLENSYEDFIVKKIDFLSNKLLYTNGLYNKFFSEHTLKFKKLIDDRNLIFNTMDEFFFSSTLSLRQRNAELKAIPYSPKGRRLYVHSILIDPTYSSINRTYQKIDQMLARVMSMTSILLYFFVFINDYVSEYHLLLSMKDELIDNFIEDDLIEFSKKISLKKIEKEDLKTQINFRNYLVSILWAVDKRSIIFDQIYKRFRIELSCNNYYKIKNTVKTQAISSFNKGIKIFKKPDIKNIEENYSLIEKADLFAESEFFYYMQQKKVKTIQGGIISFFHLAIIIFCIFFIGFDFWTSRVNDIQIDQMSFYELDPKDKINQIDCPYSVGYSKSAIDKLRFNLKNFSYVGYPPGAVRECSDEEYRYLFNSEKNSSMFYLCGNLNYTLGNPLIDYSWIDKNLIITSCSDMRLIDKTTTNCNSNPKVDETFRVEFKLKLRQLDFNDYKLKDKVWSFYSEGVYDKMLKLSIYFRNYRITNYLNNVLFAPDDYQISTIQYFTSSTGPKAEININHMLGQTWIRLIYVNFPDMLAKVFSMISILTYFITSIHSFVFEFIYKQSILDNILMFKDIECIKDIFLNMRKFGNSRIENLIRITLTNNNFSELKDEVIWHISEIYTFKNYFIFNIFRIPNEEFSYLDMYINNIISVDRIFKKNSEFMMQNRETPDINPEQVLILNHQTPTPGYG